LLAVQFSLIAKHFISTRLTILECAVVKGRSVCLSVRSSHSLSTFRRFQMSSYLFAHVNNTLQRSAWILPYQ